MKLLLIAILAVLGLAYAEEAAADDNARSSNGVIFSLYTRENPSTSQRLNIGDLSSITGSNFDSNRPTRLVTHGWRGNEQQSAVAVVRAAYITAGDYNVITVDWNSIQGIFTSPTTSVRNGGAIIAEFLDFMKENAGLNPATTQVVGHSLGAHVISFAARTASGTYEAVHGLDPAGPVFEDDDEAMSIGIQSGDAAHVEVIHTNGGGMGLWRAAGDTDFYPNGGKSQPGCILDIVGICAHFRAPLFFAESIINPTGFPTDEDAEVYMGGGGLSSNAYGIYSLTTAKNPPFALG